MELREAIEIIKRKPEIFCFPDTESAVATILNAVADGTLIPAQSREEGHPASYDPEYSYDDWMKEQTQPTPSPEPIMTEDEMMSDNLIEQAERERDKGDYYEGIEEGYNAGFRAGIEAAAEEIRKRWASTHAELEIYVRALAEQKGDEQ